MQQRLAAGDRDHRRAALVDRLEALLDAEALVQDQVRVVDLAAAGAGEVAAEERLEHQHERIARVALEALGEDVAPDGELLTKRNGQGFFAPR